MPYFYNVERKIGINIVAITAISVALSVMFLYIFLSNYIQKKRLKSIYDYMETEDYDNASYIFKDLHNKKPLNKNILITGIDLYYDMLINAEDKKTSVSSSENVVRYARQILLTSKFIENKHLVYQKMAYGYQRLGKSYYMNSYDSYKKAIESGDERISTAVELSKICYDIGLYEEAVYRLENIVEKEPENERLYYDLAEAYEGNKDYTKAIQTLSYITDKIEGDYDLEFKTYSKLGALYFRQGLYRESEFFYKKAMNIDDKNPDLYYSMGNLYRQTKRISEAIFMFREALKIDNSYRPAREALRRL